MKTEHKKYLFLTLFILIAIALRLSSIGAYLSFENLKTNREYLLMRVQNHYMLSVFFYILLYIFVAALSLPVAAPLTLIGGFLLGVLPATVATNIGATIGATIIFLCVRYLLGNRVQEKYRSQLAIFNTNIAAYGTNYLLLGRLIIFLPFFLINILSGLTAIPLTTFIWTTSLGIIPGTLIYTYAGREIGSINTLSDIFSTNVLIAFALLIGLGTIALFGKKIMRLSKIKDAK